MSNLEKASGARTRRVVVASSSGGFLCSSIATLYFYKFPILVNSAISDAFIIGLLFTWTIALVISAIYARCPNEVGLVLFGIAIFAFVVRVIPYLRLGVPFLHDPYFYRVSTQNILQTGALEPTLSGFFPQVIDLLPWPLMQLVTVTGAKVTGLGTSIWYELQEPAIGGLTSVATFLLARTATKRIDVSLIASIFVASSDLLIHYQAEYHPQGLAVLLLVLFLYAFLRSRATKGVSFGILPLVFAAGLVFVHHFSSFFIGALAVGIILVSFAVERTPVRRLRSVWLGNTLSTDLTLWMLVAVSALAYLFYYYPAVAQGFITLLERSTPPAVLVTSGPEVPAFATIGNAMKWGVLALGMFAILKSLRVLTQELYRLLIVLLLLLVAGAIGDFLTGGPADRIIALYIPVGSVFAGLGVFHLTKARSGISHKVFLRKTAVFGAVVIIAVVGMLNAEVPALLFHGSAPDNYYWSSNDLSSIGVYQPTGNWIARYTRFGSTYITEFDTRMITFYYAGRPITDVRWTELMSGDLMSNPNADYLVVNPAIPYSYPELKFDKQWSLAENNLVYSNGRVVVATLRNA